MTLLKTLSLMAILSTAIAMPVSARDTRLGHLRMHWTHHHLRDAYNQRNERFDLTPRVQRNTEDFGSSGRDPSRIGGEDPDRHPSAY
jgi:hypothetical protein